MCKLLGMSANVPMDICFSFSGLVLRGGGTGPHKDGWAIIFYEGLGLPYIQGSVAQYRLAHRPSGAGLSYQILRGGLPYSPG